jgi:hypothetical protein
VVRCTRAVVFNPTGTHFFPDVPHGAERLNVVPIVFFKDINHECTCFQRSSH